MKLQFKILLFMVCLNLSVFLVVSSGLPGTSDVNPDPSGQPTMNATQYTEHFNATDIEKKWDPGITIGIPIIGDIFSAFQFLSSHWQFLLDGFGIFLDWIGYTFITDTSALSTYLTIRAVFTALFWILMTMWFIEFISGRYMTS